MGSVAHPAAVTFVPLPQPMMVLDLATREGCKAELTSRLRRGHIPAEDDCSPVLDSQGPLYPNLNTNTNTNPNSNLRHDRL